MGLDAWLTVAAITATFVTLAFTRLAPYLVLNGALVGLMALGALPVSVGVGGFGNEGVVTVGALFIVAAGLRETGAVGFVVQRMLGRPRSTSAAVLRLSVPVAVLSAFLNNTPIVAVLLPVVSDWGRRLRIPASKLLIPLSYAAILGGLCTLVGTSTHLVVQGLLLEAGRPGLSLFDLAWVGVPCVLVGITFMASGGHRLLPAHDDGLRELLDPREYTLEMVVEEGGPFVGRSIEEAGLRHLPGVYLAEIHRRGSVRPAVGAKERLEAKDQLVFVGMVDSVVELRRTPGLRPASRTLFALDGGRSDRVFVEAVLSQAFPMLGKTVREARFRNQYNAVVLGIARQGTRIRSRVGDIELVAGDTLLLEAPPSFVDQNRLSNEFHLVSRLDAEDPPRHERRSWALAIFIGLFAAVILGVSLTAAALGAAIAMVLAGCCSEESVRRRVDWPLLLAVGASLGLGRGLEVSGAAEVAAQLILADVHDPRLVLVLIYGATALLSLFVTNAGAAVVALPVALAAADGLQMPTLPVILAVLVAASAAFASPLGYQTNLMVFGAGGYRFRDFLRLGLPMSLLVAATALGLLVTQL
ncbi:MAG: SLC13 family permease [Myxococcota bacterium]